MPSNSIIFVAVLPKLPSSLQRPSAAFMKATPAQSLPAASQSNPANGLLLGAVLASVLFTSACATRTTSSGGRETNVLGGAVTVSTNSYQPPTPAAAVDVDTSKLVGKGDPSGKKISLFWGLINLHDY